MSQDLKKGPNVGLLKLKNRQHAWESLISTSTLGQPVLKDFDIAHMQSKGMKSYTLLINAIDYRRRFPHVLHACAAMLQQRKCEGRGETRFDGLETKLLYTMHWIVLDAASECEDMDNERNRGLNTGQNNKSYLFTIKSCS